MSRFNHNIFHPNVEILILLLSCPLIKSSTTLYKASLFLSTASCLMLKHMHQWSDIVVLFNIFLSRFIIYRTSVNIIFLYVNCYIFRIKSDGFLKRTPSPYSVKQRFLSPLYINTYTHIYLYMTIVRLNCIQ